MCSVIRINGDVAFLIVMFSFLNFFRFYSFLDGWRLLRVFLGVIHTRGAGGCAFLSETMLASFVRVCPFRCAYMLDLFLVALMQGSLSRKNLGNIIFT